MRDGGHGMANEDDVDEQFRRLTAGIDLPTADETLPKPSRASMREVKREAKQRKKAASKPPPPVQPHRAYLAEPARRPPRMRSEKLRTALILTVVVLVLGTGIWFQMSHGESLAPGQAAAAGTGYPTPGNEESSAPLGTPPEVKDAPGKYAFIFQQKDETTPVAYDPCRPIHVVVNPTHEPAQGAKLLADAMAAVTAATGLQFVDDGTTDEKVRLDRELFQPDRYGDRWAPVVIAWPTGAEQPDFIATSIGQAGSRYTSVGDGPKVYVTGTVELDSDWFGPILTQPQGYARAKAVVLHELGHLVGLAHVSDRSELMFAQETPEVTAYAAGDLAGLAKLGAGSCEPGL